MDCSPPGSSVRGISQARVLEWVAISFSGDLPDPGIKPVSPALAGGFFTAEPPGKPLVLDHQGSSDNLCSRLGCILHQSKALALWWESDMAFLLDVSWLLTASQKTLPQKTLCIDRRSVFPFIKTYLTRDPSLQTSACSLLSCTKIQSHVPQPAPKSDNFGGQGRCNECERRPYVRHQRTPGSGANPNCVH